MWAKVHEFLLSCPLYMPIALLELCWPQLTPGKPWLLAGKPVPLLLTSMSMLLPPAGRPLPLHEDSWHAHTRIGSWHANAVGTSGPTSASVAR